MVSGEHLSPIQNTARPSAQPTISLLCGAQAHRPGLRQSWGSPRNRTTQIVKDQVRVPATAPAMREKAADNESAERSSSPCTVADGELIMYLGRCISEGERAPFPESSPEKAPVFTSSSERAPVPPSSPESPETHQCPLSCPLLPPPPLLSGSSSAHPQPTIYTVWARGSAILHCHRGWGIP